MYTELYKNIVRPKLFALDPEEAHDKATRLLEKISRSPLLCAMLGAVFTVRDRRLERVRMGLTFRNPVGLAAGFSKYGVGLPALEAVGFGFLEIGGVTPSPQDGSPKLRMFRCEADEALINRMGFNNPGAYGLRNTLLKNRQLRIPIGINLGKGKETPLAEAANDYCDCLETLYHNGDFFVVNVSSPNTPGLRTLQNPEVLDGILGAIAAKRAWCRGNGGGRKPILVKIAPDLEFDMLDRIIECVQKNKMDGLVIANTTTSRTGLKSKHKDETGGASGRLLFKRSLTLVSRAKSLAPKLTVIGVGGIFSGQDAWYMLHQAKADLVQVYTGLVYEGPGLVHEINKEILRRLKKASYSSIEDVR